MSKLMKRLEHVAGDLKDLRDRYEENDPLGPVIPASRLRYLSSKEIAALRQRLGLSQQELAEWLDMSLVSISRWERDQGHPSAREAKILARLAELVDRTDGRLRPDELVRFFGSPHEDLYNERPVDVLSTEIGYRAVRSTLKGLLAGEYT